MFKILENGKAPTKGTKFSACVDLYASESVTIGAGETKLVGLGVAICSDKIDSIINGELANKAGSEHFERPLVVVNAFANGWLSSHYLQLMLRDELAEKGLLQPSVKIFGLDFKDEIKMIIHNPHTENTIQNSVLPMVVDLINKMFNSNLKHTFTDTTTFKIKKGDKIGQIMLCEHKTYLFGIESDVERDGGFGSTDSV